MPRRESYVTELYEWFRTFMNECPSELITLHEFRRHFCEGTVVISLLNMQNRYFVHWTIMSLYRGKTVTFEIVINKHASLQDGVVDFREYVMAISMLMQGSPTEKLRWSFKLFDKNRDGTITREEVLNIMKAVYKMSIAGALTNHNPLTPEECTNRIFGRLDKYNNAVISQEEFIEGALDDEWIRKMLECDPNTVNVDRPQKRDIASGAIG